MRKSEFSQAHENRNSDFPIYNDRDHQKVQLIENLFFAYRDFIAEPDDILAQYDFGRAHHRILHFVYQNAGITVRELLDILQITKQSLNRVLKQLIVEGYVMQKIEKDDRRERHHYLTEKGKNLAWRLLDMQMKRMDKAFGDMDSEDIHFVQEFLTNLQEPATQKR